MISQFNIKILSATTLLLLSQDANALGRATKAHSGISVGAQIGYAFQNSRLKQQFTFGPLYKHNKGISGKDFIGGLNVGYGFFSSSYFLMGLEIKGDMTDLSAGLSEGATTLYRNKTSVKMRTSFGGALKFGGLIYQVLPYVRAGLLIGKWKASTSLIASCLTGTNSKNSWRPGWELGVGVDFPLAPRFSIGGEFIHAEYKKITYKSVLFYARLNQTRVIMKNTVTPRTNTIMLRVKYRIC